MERRRDIDILKGICMISLVFCHTGISFLWFHYIFVVGFYFVAGYTFKDKPFYTFLKSKIVGLYIPFVINCIIGLCIIWALSKVTGNYYYFTPYLFSKYIFMFNLPHNIFAPAWFLFPLFLILFIYFILNRIVKNSYIILTISFILYIVSYSYWENLSKYVWNDCAWVINVLIGLFAFAYGYTIKSKKKIEYFIFNSKYSMDLFYISVLVRYIIYTYFPFDIDLRSGKCSNIILNTIMILFGMIYLFILSKLIDKTKLIGNVISVFGKHTRAIMFFHILSYSIVTLGVHYILKYPWPDTWTNSYNYSGFWILNGISGLCIPTICSILTERLKMKLIKKRHKHFISAFLM